MDEPATPASPARKVRSRRRRLLLVPALLLALAVVEVVLRVLPLPALQLRNIWFDPNDTRYVPHPYLAYLPRPSWSYATGTQSWHHNSLGFRGPEFPREKPPGTFRIVCLGGSSTYGHTESSDEATWPARLAQQLARARPEREFHVINAGVSGRNSYEMVIDMAVRLTDLDPDLYLYYESINDVRLWIWPGIKPDNSHARAVWPTCKPPWWQGLAEQSRLFLVGRRYLTDYWDQLDLGAWVVAGWNEQKRLWDDFAPEGPVYFQRNLASMVALARGHGARIAFGTQACMAADLVSPSDHKGMSEARARIYLTGRDLGVPVCDVATKVPQERRFLKSDVHATDDGARLIARLWSEFLLAGDLLDP